MHRAAGETPTDGSGDSRYTDDFIPYLLSRAHVLVSYPVRLFSEERGVTERDYATLGLLSMTGSATGATLATKLAHTGQAPDAADIAKLDARGWIEADGDAWRLTASGRALFIEILSRSRAIEQDLLEGFDPGRGLRSQALPASYHRQGIDRPAAADRLKAAAMRRRARAPLRCPWCRASRSRPA